ncbi:MAG: hypothetical protein AUJ32_02390 [Parcubacteria group bacterium CG1_02_40_82]|uniref:Uncharacterized protein n=2 Tax=Candidatus Portnoyibacteriota TaxID=1817913 RepID=A0A2M7YPW9_9BACT|nr:MAG: hypothetical protein AUJ32_02390 [Parcubacteria group bacterium CG1_02_40_82]PIQ75022.1 MAG: hypothetical protein COV84_03435 [Candidatus Portnoybacteria bacterium CG11_big_fil_rev_8_21_14_0_20_40_15]PJA64942.1 MAG: hypothetical protein CO159_00360 [Candidatus Portnoybacteria bacterium CG_4_9_14_3_um_filter_40_10]
MVRNFRGYKDESVVILKHVFPNSDLVLSTPVEFSKKVSGVYIEGDPIHQLLLYEHLKKLVKIDFGEICFGEWIGVLPLDEDLSWTVIHYEAVKEIDKIQLLNMVLLRHMAAICNLRLSLVTELTVKVRGDIAQEQFIVLPKDFANGEIALPGTGGIIDILA